MQLNLKSKFDLLKITAWFCAINFLLFLFIRLLLIASFDADIGGVENNVVYSISKMIGGDALYENPELGNFDITQYTPIYYYVAASIARVLQLHPLNDLHAIYMLGRSLSLIFNLLSVWLVFLILNKQFRVNKHLSIIAASTYFIHLTRIQFATRPDALFALLFVLMTACFVGFFQQHHKKNSYLAVGLMIAAFSVFVKQTGIQYVLLIPAFFLVTKDFKNFFFASVFLTVVLIIGFTLFNQLYPSNFMLNTITGINNGTSVARVYDVFSHFFLKYQVIMVLGLILSVRYFFESPQQKNLKFLSFLNVGIFSFAIVTSVKEGSWINYYNEFVALSIMLITVEVKALLDSSLQQSRLTSFARYAAAIYLIVLLPNVILQKVFHEHFNHLKNTSAIFEQRQQTALWLSHHLSKDAYFISFDDQINAMLPTHAVVPNKDIVPTQSKFNYQVFTDNFNSGNIKYLVKPKANALNDFMGADFSGGIEVFSTTDYVVIQNKNTKQ